MRPALVLALAVLVLGGCAERYHFRPLRPDEAAILIAASSGLLPQVGYLGAGPSCQIGAAINEVPARDVEVLPATSPDDCVLIYATTGALDLPQRELRALVAHGLAHLALGHARTTGRRVSTSGRRATATGDPQQRIYSTQEETEADRYAARLLNVTAPGGAGCPALGEVLDRVSAEGSRWSEWTVQHPHTAARAAAALRLCASER
jgi:hypothetical protein